MDTWFVLDTHGTVAQSLSEAELSQPSAEYPERVERNQVELKTNRLNKIIYIKVILKRRVNISLLIIITLLMFISGLHKNVHPIQDIF